MSQNYRVYPVVNERWLILVVGLIQFINILDFMMVMPMGPDFARALKIPTHHIGYIGGSYTFAAALTGFVGALFLDRFARHLVLLVSLAGLIAATAIGALAWDLTSLMSARVLAGMFGGTLSASAVALIADYIPPERRGAAMGKVMGSFAVASVLGVPFGLELSQRLGWQAPFLALAVIGLIVFAVAWLHIPRRAHSVAHDHFRQQILRIGMLLQSRLVLFAFSMGALAMTANFMIVPNISAHFQQNLHYPREHLGILYLVGGLVSFFGMGYAGKWVDRSSSTRVSIFVTCIYVLALLIGFVIFPTPVPALLVFVMFMASSSARMVALQTLTSKVPPPEVRAAYMSMSSSLIHIGSSLGAFVSSVILVDSPDGRLLHVPELGMLSIAISCVVPVLFYLTERKLKAN